MSILDSIAQRNFSEYLLYLKDKQNLRAQDEFGNTILHRLAEVDDWDKPKAVLASVFSNKYSLRSWLVEIGKDTILELAQIQNNAQDTCIHTAVKRDNWAFAASLGPILNYRAYPDRLKRNKMGFTEYELAMVLYGVCGRTDGVRSIFDGIDRVYAGSLGEVTPFRGAVDINDSFPILKRAAKAVKVVILPLENGNQIKAAISSTDAVYETAVEADYPSPYSTIEDMNEINKLYESRNIPANLRRLK